jgi:hypothetical protein
VNTRQNVDLHLDRESGKEVKTRLSPAQADESGDEKKHAGLAQLQARYVEAQELAERGQPHENLDWILGGRRDLDRDPLAIHSKRIELISLWLEDLVAELENPPSGPDTAESESTASYQYRYAAAQKLRDATRVFLKLFPQSCEDKTDPTV